MAKRVKINAGDVFYIRADENLIAAAQVIKSAKGEIQVVVFEKLYALPEEIIVPFCLNDKVIITGYTVDTWFALDRWQVIANATLALTHELLYKVETGEGTYLTDSNTNIIRKASPEEAIKYQYKSSFSPVSFVNALKVYHKLVPYDSYYEKMFYSKRS